MDNKSKRFRELSVLAAPVCTVIVTLYVFSVYDIYPMGTRSISWCDMSQQVIPLLCQFKDILSGDSGIFFSFRNASGMGFWGVFFFFLASPFTFLVAFVDKSEMACFANILVMLKMACSAMTAGIYFVKSEEHKKLDLWAIVLLSFIYSMSGYAFMYYQNLIWLDMVYLFPLLMLSLERLQKNGSPVMYTIVTAAMITVNYYIGYMIVVFLLLYMAAYTVIFSKGNRSGGPGSETGDAVGTVCRRFILGSLCAALITAVVWIPSFFEYLSSARGDSIIENLSDSSFVTSYQTVFPLVTASTVIITLAFADVFILKRRKYSQRRLWAVMAFFVMIPIVIEPVNKMWHMGSYMSFPARYAFIAVFMFTLLSADLIEQKTVPVKSTVKYGAGMLVSLGIIYLLYCIFTKFYEENYDSLTKYSHTLWGDETSYKLLLVFIILGILCSAAVYALHRKGWLEKTGFLFAVSLLAIVEAANGIKLYMVPGALYHEDDNYSLANTLTYENELDDDSFYRVKTDSKIMHYNLIGALGYDSLSHYTSLTSESYMFTMKRLGYTSVWMEIGSSGGTELTDAFLSVGYEMSESGGEYTLEPLENKLPLGIISLSDCVGEEIPEDLTRAEVQQYVFEKAFDTDEQLIYEAEPDEGEYDFCDGRYEISENEIFVYRYKVSGNMSLYFDCFDELTNNLSEPIYNSFSVRVNGSYVSSSYPVSTNNGVLKLGEFEDETVVIQVTALQNVSCASFGVFGLDTDLLSEKCEAADTIGLSEIKNGLSGSFTADEDCSALLAVPYSEGFKIKVNGETVSYTKALSGFIAFDLPAGECDIKITYKPKGFTVGISLSAAGLLLLAVYIIFRRKRPETLNREYKTVNASSKIILLLAGAAVIAAVYILPIIINLLYEEQV